MIKAKVKTNINFPRLKIQKDLLHIADRIFVPIIEEGIDRGVDISGNRFPSLEPATIKAKARKGLRSEPLIATGKLRRSFFSSRKGNNSVVISLRPDRKEIGKYLQVDGVGKKRKKFDFFGVSKKMENLAMAYMRNRINQEIKNAR